MGKPKMTTHPVSMKQLILIIFLIIQLEFLFLAWRVEHNDSATKTLASKAQVVAGRTADHAALDRVAFKAACESRRENLTQLNQLLDRLSIIEVTNTSVPKPIRDAKIKAYTDAHLDLPVCAKPSVGD